MGKISVIMNKLIYLRQAILDLSKIIVYKFHYNYMLPMYSEHLKLCYMNADSFVYDIQTDNFYKDIASYVEARFNTRQLQLQPFSSHKSKQEGYWRDEGRTGRANHDQDCGTKTEVVCV